MSNISKRSWKLQEFTAHSANVNCLALGHKSGRVLVTGGDDKKVNLWAIGNQSCIMSLGGHLTPVECVKFGQTEDLVCAGSQTGVLKVWDLEATKLIRTLSGHKAAIKCIDFHPYGEYLASGSLDTVIKMWDIRCKGSIFSYKGHKQTVNSIKFSPDGQWIVSGDEEGMIKIWDLRIGRVLTDLNKHSGAITDVEFHPNEFLLGSSGADRSVYIWDLENFQPISKSEKEPSIIRCLHFAIDGECLFGGCAEQLKVYGWEPTCICDTVSIGWGKVQDMAISHNQLIGASFYLSTVLICVVDLTKVCLTAPPSQLPPKQPQSNFIRDTVVRKSFNKHQSPSSESSKMKMDVKPIEEYETEPEDESSFFIANRNDYNSIFSPQRTLTRSPLPSEFKTVVTSSSVQNTTSQNVSIVSRTKVQQQLNKTTSANHNASSQINLNSVLLQNGQCVSSSPPKLHQNSPSLVRQQSPPPVTLRSATVTSFSSLNSDEHSDNFLSSETDENVQANIDFDVIPSSNNNLPNGISVHEFLPSDYKIAGHGNFNNDYTENEAISTITRGHEPMITVLKNRKKGLLVVYTIWRKKDLKCAMEQVVSMNDIALVVDVLSVINGKSSLWSLDICAILLPSISELLQSKYEVYMSVGCDSLRLILRNFSSVIKTNTLWSVPTIGVDITKEERYKKCMKCYSVLVSIRAFLLKRQTMQGKLGQSFRELHTMLQEIDAT